MQNRRKTISLSTSMKINLSYKKVKKPITKMLSSSGFKKNIYLLSIIRKIIN